MVLQVVSDCNTMLTPFLPHSAQRVFELLGGEGIWAAQPELVEVSEDEFTYPILTGDYAAEAARWESAPIKVGGSLRR